MIITPRCKSHATFADKIKIMQHNKTKKAHSNKRKNIQIIMLNIKTQLQVRNQCDIKNKLCFKFEQAGWCSERLCHCMHYSKRYDGFKGICWLTFCFNIRENTGWAIDEVNSVCVKEILAIVFFNLWQFRWRITGQYS